MATTTRAESISISPAMLDPRYGYRCLARKPGGRQCDFTARWVSLSGAPVCGFHTNPEQELVGPNEGER